jgi:hypothetical protein
VPWSNGQVHSAKWRKDGLCLAYSHVLGMRSELGLYLFFHPFGFQNPVSPAVFAVILLLTTAILTIFHNIRAITDPACKGFDYHMAILPSLTLKPLPFFQERCFSPYGHKMVHRWTQFA